MSYELTLTYGERQAIDWVGHRDRNGDELYRLLWLNSEIISPADEFRTWDDKRDIVVKVPEAVAWTVAEIINEGLPHFSSDFRSKLLQWRGRIV